MLPISENFWRCKYLYRNIISKISVTYLPSVLLTFGRSFMFTVSYAEIFWLLRAELKSLKNSVSNKYDILLKPLPLQEILNSSTRPTVTQFYKNDPDKWLRKRATFIFHRQTGNQYRRVSNKNHKLSLLKIIKFYIWFFSIYL